MLYTLRIAVVTTSYPRFPGDPSGHFVAAEVALLAQRGEEVRVIQPEGAHRVAFGWPGFAARARVNPIASLTAASWIVDARRALARSPRIDRVVAHWALPCACPIAEGCDAPLTVVSHGGDVRLLVALPRPLRARLALRIARRAEDWRFVSAALRDSLVEALPRDAASAVARIARVEPSPLVLPDLQDAIARRRRQIGGAPISVSVGRLVVDKRVDAAIAYAATERRSLVVVGDGPDRARLEALAKHARREGARICFVGRVPREEALAWIAVADEVLHASRAEGLSHVVREAEALGVPVRGLAED